MPVPKSPNEIRGVIYTSSPSDWSVDEPVNAGFACLGFKVTLPQKFMYSYRMDGDGGEGSTFTVEANGDLDGDGVMSSLTMSGTVQGGKVIVIPVIHQEHPDE